MVYYFIFISGTKGAVLTNTVRDISVEFQSAVAIFRSAPFDVMNIKIAEFDEHFYTFRLTVKQVYKVVWGYIWGVLSRRI